jgi:hypothetical protein
MSQTATWLHAAFDSPADAQSALEQLAEDGVAANDIEVRTSIPLVHEVCPVGLEVRSRVPLMAVAGGLLGGTAAFLLVSLTSLAYPLPTGGMPIVPLPTVGVITFEGLALGAILCTVATVFYECRLPRLGGRAGPLDHHLAAGSIIVAAKSTDGASEAWAAKATATEVHEVL